MFVQQTMHVRYIKMLLYQTMPKLKVNMYISMTISHSGYIKIGNLYQYNNMLSMTF